MSVFRPRSRIISIRLSEEEYTGLKRLCSDTGARSVSDLAREGMRTLLNETSRADTLGAWTDEFRLQMRSLDRKIEELTAKLLSANSNGRQ
jgi:Arc/MetJ-type ribon-helix-helix transcriptional regulator